MCYLFCDWTSLVLLSHCDTPINHFSSTNWDCRYVPATVSWTTGNAGSLSSKPENHAGAGMLGLVHVHPSVSGTMETAERSKDPTSDLSYTAMCRGLFAFASIGRLLAMRTSCQLPTAADAPPSLHWPAATKYHSAPSTCVAGAECHPWRRKMWPKRDKRNR